MSTYKVATGSSVALVSLALIVPQPASPGVKASRRTYSADGAIHDEGLHIVLEWGVIGTPTILTALLTQFGLNAATSAAVTVYVPNQIHAYTRYNGTAMRPEVSRESYFLRGIQIVVRDLVAL